MRLGLQGNRLGRLVVEGQQCSWIRRSFRSIWNVRFLTSDSQGRMSQVGRQRPDVPTWTSRSGGGSLP